MSLTSIFQDIADAIRSKTGKTEGIYPVDMASEIEGIESGGYKLKNMPSGAVSSFNDGTDLPLNKLKVSIEPVQDLHGYDAPWFGGGGKNLLNIGGRVNQTEAEVKYTSDENYIIGNGTKNGSGYVRLTELSMTLDAGTYYAKGFVISGTATKGVDAYITNGSTNLTGSSIMSTERVFTLESQTTVYPRLAVWTDGAVLTNYTIGIVVSKTSGIDKFYPYSNICPISGWESVNVYVSPTEDEADGHTTTTSLGRTVYGGTLDVVSGVLTVTNANIASYNGEIINEPWISSMDAYSVGATPTIGAQVVYPLATPQIIQLTPTAVKSLIELNNIWADTGDIINGEYFKAAGIGSGTVNYSTE